jgi:hypothetical protein
MDLKERGKVKDTTIQEECTPILKDMNRKLSKVLKDNNIIE